MHLSRASAATLADAETSLRAAQPGGAAQRHDDGQGFDWRLEVARDAHGWELEVNRLVLALGQALRPAAAAGSVVQLEVELGRADRAQMNTHVGLGFGPELLARLGAWGIALAVTSALI
ncbi:MAG TPA: hypothetical protein VGC42_30240 [Kofleriaceae bacterium]